MIVGHRGSTGRRTPGLPTVLLAAVLVLVLAGCTAGATEPSAVASERGAASRGRGGPGAGDIVDGGSAGAGSAGRDGATPDFGPVELIDGADVVDVECYGSETRCGVVLVPQVNGSPDLVGVGFEEWTAGRTGTPLVILDWGWQSVLDGDDFPDRPVLLIGGRDRWPGGPALECPAFDGLAPEAAPDEVTALAGECRAWLEDAGLDVAGASREARISDVANTIAALGHDSVSMVAPGVEAEVVAGVAGLLPVERAVYVNPDFLADGTAWRSSNALLDAMEEGWRQCEAATSCTPVGSIDDFFAAVEALGPDPLPNPWQEDEVIGAADVLTGMRQLPDQPHLVAALPELHQALLARDADTVNRFLTSVFDVGTMHDTVTWCQRRRAPMALDAAPPVLAEHIRQTMVSHQALCDGLGLGAEPPEGAVEPWPGLIVETTSARGGDGRDAIGPVVVEPTVGWPTTSCLVTTITAYLDEGTVDDSACGTGIRFATRDDPVVPVPVSVQDDPGWTIAVVVPEGWVSPWSGYWERRADIRDDTSVGIYSWEGGEPEATLDDLIWDYDLVDAVRTSREVGDRTWFLAEAASYDDEYHQVLAVADVDGVSVIVELAAEPDAVDETIRQVLEPALASVAIEWVDE